MQKVPNALTEVGYHPGRSSGLPLRSDHVPTDRTAWPMAKEDTVMKTHARTGLGLTQEGPSETLQNQIPVRAYQIYEQRGREDGHDLDVWLQAELEEARRETSFRPIATRLPV